MKHSINHKKKQWAKDRRRRKTVMFQQFAEYRRYIQKRTQITTCSPVTLENGVLKHRDANGIVSATTV